MVSIVAFLGDKNYIFLYIKSNNIVIWEWRGEVKKDHVPFKLITAYGTKGHELKVFFFGILISDTKPQKLSFFHAGKKRSNLEERRVCDGRSLKIRKKLYMKNSTLIAKHFPDPSSFLLILQFVWFCSTDF